MAGNPLQGIIQMVMQQAQQNPQMLMQLASSQPVQSILQTLLSPQELKNETGSFSGFPNATPLSPALGGGSPYPIEGQTGNDRMDARLFKELMDSKQRMAPPRPNLYFDMEEQRDLNEKPYPKSKHRGFYPGAENEQIPQVLQMLMASAVPGLVDRGMPVAGAAATPFESPNAATDTEVDNAVRYEKLMDQEMLDPSNRLHEYMRPLNRLNPQLYRMIEEGREKFPDNHQYKPEREPELEEGDEEPIG